MENEHRPAAAPDEPHTAAAGSAVPATDEEVRTAAGIYERFEPGLVHTMALHHFHRYFFAAPYCAGKRVLDIACGSGYGTALLGKCAESVLGVDIDEAAVRACRETYRDANLRFVTGSVEAIPAEDAAFDVVVSYETIEHVDADAQRHFMREIRRVLRPGGLLIISSPGRDDNTRNRFHVHELAEEEFLALIGGSFPHLRHWKQKIALGSFILPIVPDGAPLEKFAIRAEAGKPVVPAEADIESKYMIVLASDGRLPQRGGSVNLDTSGEIMDAMIRQFVLRSVNPLRSEFARYRENVRRTIRQSQHEAQQAEERAAAAIAARDAELKKLRAEIEADAAAIAARDAELKKLRAEIEADAAVIAARDAELKKLRAKIEADAAAIAARDAELKKLREQARADAPTIAARDAELKKLCGKIEADAAVIAARDAELKKTREQARQDRQDFRRQLAEGVCPLKFRDLLSLGKHGLLHPRRTLRLIRDLRLIRRSRMFSQSFYAAHNPDIAANFPGSLIMHFCRFGWREGRDPSVFFPVRTYLKRHPELSEQGINPLVHYLRSGMPQNEIE